MNLKHFILFFAIIFNSFPLRAITEIEWFDLKNRIQFRVNLVDEFLEEKEFEGVWKRKNKLIFKGIVLSDIPSVCNPVVLNLKNKILITIPGTGQVYQLNPSTNSFERLDKTFFRGYNFHALQFISNDSLFSLGGEGFWRSNSILTFFDFKNQEWEKLTTKGESPSGLISLSSGYIPGQTKIVAVESFHDGNYKVSKLGYYELNLENRAWSKIGDVDLMNLKKLGLNTANFNLVGNYLFLNSPQIGYYVNLETNELFKYEGDKKLFFLIESKLFYQENKVFSIRIDKNNPNLSLKVDSLAIKDLIKESKLIGSFYEEFTFLNEPDFGLLLGISLCLVVSILFNVKLTVAKRRQLTRLSYSSLPTGGLEFIKKFKENDENYLVSTEEMSIFLNCENKAFDTQRQYRAQFINSMNLYFFENHQIEEAILRKTSNEDKRFIKYGIRKEALSLFD
jgi:hypothetical protein